MLRRELQLLTVLVVLGAALAQDNATEEEPPAVTPPPKPDDKNSDGALETLAKALLDIPLGIVEAFKDGAEAIEKTVFGFITSLFR